MKKSIDGGKQVVTVTALLGESALKTRRLGGGPPTISRVLHIALAAVGVALALVGLIQVVRDQAGVAALLMVLGMGQLVYALAWLRDQRAAGRFTVGNGAAADLHIERPELGLGVAHSLVRLTPAGPVLQLPGQAPAPIPPHSHQMVNIGQLRFFVQSAAAGAVGGGLGVDWEANVYHGASFAAHAMLLFLVFALPPNHNGSDLGNMRHRPVTFSMRDVEDKDEAIQPWLKRPVQQEHAATADEPEPKRPSRVSTPRGGGKDNRPAGGGKSAKHLAVASAKTAGILDILNKGGGAYMNSIFSADSALTDGAMEAMDGLQGNDFGTDMSIGGLSLSDGTHSYGPGSGIMAGPLGTIGKRGGPGGPGGPGYGSGFVLPKRKKPKFKGGLRAERITDLKGALSKSIIRRVIRRHLNEVRYCYQRELVANRDLYGRLTVKFTIAPNGQVIASGIKQSTLGNRTVETCIAQAVRRWLFPKPKDGGIVMVSYPFVLKSAGK